MAESAFSGKLQRNIPTVAATLWILFFFIKYSTQEGFHNVTVIGGRIHSTGSTVELTFAINTSTLLKIFPTQYINIGWYLQEIDKYPHCNIVINQTEAITGLLHPNCKQGATSMMEIKNKFLYWNMTWITASEFNNITYIANNADGERVWIAELLVQDCTIPGKYISCDPVNTSTYNEKAVCNCVDGSKLFKYHQMENAVSSFDALCSDIAKWKPSEGYACWHAPNITLEYSTTKCCNYTEEETAIFYCKCMEEGYPTNYTYWLHISGTEYDGQQVPAVSCLQSESQNYTIVMNYMYNHAILECRTNHTLHENGNTPFSSKLTLDVQYGPKIVNDTSCFYQSSKTHHNVTIRLFFLANSILDNNSVLLKVFSQNDSVKSYNFGVVSFHRSDLHEYRLELRGIEKGTTFKFFAKYSLKNLTRNFTYNVNAPACGASTTKPTTVSSYLNTGTTTQSENSTATSLSTPTSAANIPIIAASASGGGLAVFAISVLVYKLKRRSKNASAHTNNTKHGYVETTLNGTTVKEDVINPLYGTSTNTGVQRQENLQKSDSEKEEKVNPVYQPIPETYSQVDVKNKKKQNPKSETNKAFTSDNQTAIYAVVDKKDKPSTSGQSNKEVAEQEATYSEVKKNKPKKRKDDDEDEDLHGSSKKT